MTSTSEGLDTSVVACLSIICIIGVITNIIVIVVTLRKAAGKKLATDVFIINLAVSDVILGGITLPLIMIDAILPEFTKNAVACKIKMSMPLFNIMTSISTMVVISFERMRVIVRKRQASLRQAIVAVVITWVFSLVITAPQLYEYRIVEKWEEDENETEITCSSTGVDPTFIKAYASIVLVLAYLLPMALVIKNYTHVIIIVKQASQRPGAISNNKLRVLGVLIALTVVFVLLWLPYFVLFVNEELTGTDDSSLSASLPHVIKQTFVALSVVSNPIIYILFLPGFRQGLTNLFLCNNQITPNTSEFAGPNSLRPGFNSVQKVAD
nr:hypothetical protein BaRGS_002593 [Batillaria attramentaria]